MTTWPPMSVVRKLSLRSRIRSAVLKATVLFIAASSTEVGGNAIRNDTDVRSDERDNVVDRGDTIAGDLLIEELGFLFVDGSSRLRNKNLAVNEGREFHSEELSVSN